MEDARNPEADRTQMLKLCLEGSDRTQRVREKVEVSINRLPDIAKQQLMSPDSPDLETLWHCI